VNSSSRLLSALSPRRDLAIPAVLLMAQLIGAAVVGGGDRPFHPVRLGALGWALLAVGPAALVARRRHPVAALWAAFAATLPPSGSRAALLSLIAAFCVAATAGHRRPAWLAMGTRFAWGTWFSPLAFGTAVPPLNDTLLLAGWLLALVIAAEATRIRCERVAESRAARQIDRRRRDSERRLTVARDLHDVIGHQISLISVQANVGLDLMDSQPEQARAALTAIKTASKEALEELRSALTTLRREDDAPRSPAPRLDRLAELVESARSAGLSVELEINKSRRQVPAAVHLAGYRIIQESLTNVARHAGPARVTVRVAYDEQALLIEVANDGKAASARPQAIGAGSGIAGMRERAAALGGDLSAGFRPGGGFLVSARIPAWSWS
jgi:signal transduction histidine kinase